MQNEGVTENLQGAASASSEAGPSTGHQNQAAAGQQPAAQPRKRTRNSASSSTGPTKRPGSTATRNRTRNRNQASSQQGVTTGMMPIASFGAVNQLFSGFWKPGLSIGQNRLALKRSLNQIIDTYNGPNPAE